MKRLDKVLGNDDWLEIFSNCSTIHLPKTYLDHNPLLVELIPRGRQEYRQSFRLESFWCKHPDFQNLVSKNWTGMDYCSASKNFASGVRSWKDKTFGDIFSKKKENFGKTTRYPKF